jgi:uncharacterized protein YndB with AHSA1/START domain
LILGKLGSGQEGYRMTVTTPLGRVLADEEGVRLEFVRPFADPREDVWAALTERDRVARWFGAWTGDPTSGSVELVMNEEEGSISQTVGIVECLPPTRLVVDMPSPDGTWRLEASLRAQPGVTTLVFSQRLAEPYDASSIGPGWHYYLDRLGAVVEDTAVPENWDDYYPWLQDAYAPPR